MGDAFRIEMIMALRDVRQQLGAARGAQQRVEAEKAAVRLLRCIPRVVQRSRRFPRLLRALLRRLRRRLRSCAWRTTSCGTASRTWCGA